MSKDPEGYFARDGEVFRAASKPEGAVEITRQQYKEAIQQICEGKVVSVADGFRVVDPPKVEDPPPPPEPVTLVTLKESVDEYLDSVVHTKGYDSILSISTYVSSKNAKWAEEAQKFLDYRDKVWDAAFKELADIEAGSVPMPEKNEELIAKLPTIEW